MLHRIFQIRSLLLAIALWLGLMVLAAPAEAVDNYVVRYLRATEPIALKLNEAGDLQSFTPDDLSQGKRLFEQNCLNCHVGGATLPDPTVPLSLTALSGAVPPRDNVDNLVAFFRQPMAYDGSEPSDWCRQVPESWLSQAQVENLAAFVLRAAEKAPGWGTSSF